MELGIGTLLLGAGLAGGVANAIAGGATLITFPAMLASGLPAIVANASNAVAVAPGHLVAAFADRSRLPALNLPFLVTVATSGIGGAIGAALLLSTPEKLFTLLVPGLIGIATLVFAFSRHIQKVIATKVRSVSGETRWVLLASMSIYGGYFGAGLGVMLLAVLSVTGEEDIRQANVLKNVLATAVSATTIATFVVQGVIRWPETVVMLSGAIPGGFLGGRLIAILPPSVVRAIIIAVGTAMTLAYAWYYWV
jgi:uncharacterized membrane protein YfcA